MSTMQYMAIIFDIDGTAVPLGDMAASPRLQSVVQTAQKSGILSAATGRGPEYAKTILESIGLTSPCVIMGGAAIIAPKTNELVWGNPMDKKQVDAVLHLLRDYPGEVALGINPTRQVVYLHDQAQTENTYVIYVLGIDHEVAEKLTADLSTIDNTVGHSTPSWIKGMVDVHITHRAATKEHGIQTLINLLDLKKEQVIGVGDSANDLPIFKAVGHRVAMDNASEDLKKLADEIAPPVDKDGLAQIIEKYFL